MIVGSFYRLSEDGCFLLYYLAVHGPEGRRCVAFIGVDVHSEREFRADADYDVSEDERTRSVELYADDLFVGDSESLGVGGGHVDVALGDDAAL